MEEVNLAKWAVGVIADLVMTFKKKQSKTRNSKSKIYEEYFNCGKKGYYTEDCHSSTLNKRKLEESSEKAKQAW